MQYVPYTLVASMTIMLSSSNSQRRSTIAVPKLSFQNSLFELLYNRDGSVGIQSSGGLIEKQHLGLYDQFHSNTGPLPLSTRYSTKKLIPNLHTSIFYAGHCLDMAILRQIRHNYIWHCSYRIFSMKNNN